MPRAAVSPVPASQLHRSATGPSDGRRREATSPKLSSTVIRARLPTLPADVFSSQAGRTILADTEKERERCDKESRRFREALEDVDVAPWRSHTMDVSLARSFLDRLTWLREELDDAEMDLMAIEDEEDEG